MFYDLCTNDLTMSIHEEKHLKFCEKKRSFFGMIFWLVSRTRGH